MKKKIFKTLFLVSLFVSLKSIKAQCSLDQVGGVNALTTSALSDMTVVNGGTVYTASYNSTLGKIFLHSVVIAGTYTTVANIPTTTSAKPVVCQNKANGKIYVVIKDDGAGQVGKVYYLSAGSLIQLGPAFSGTNKVSDLSIAFNSLGEEYVAYTDITNANKSTVKKWDGVSSWVSVGTGTVSPGAGYFNSLAIDNTNTPVLAFQSVSNASVTVVSKFTGTWVSVGTGTVGNVAANSKLKVAANGDYYLGYTETSGSVVVQRYNGSVWSGLGSPVGGMSFSANTFDLELDPNDMPYFISQYNTSFYAVAYRYAAPSWVNVIGGNISTVNSPNLNVSVDNTGSPYFFYVDQPGNNGLNVKTLTSPISISSQPLSVTRCNGQSGTFNIGVVGGVPNSYQWQNLISGTYINSSAPYGASTNSFLTFTAASAMNQDQVRNVVFVGCKNIISNTATLTVNTLSVSMTSTNPTCYNTSNGAISSTVTGGSTPYTYSWSPIGGSAATATGLYGTTYTLNTTDNIGCTTSQTLALSTPPSINSSFAGNQTFCSGGSTTMTVIATGGVGAFTYSWTPSVNVAPTTGSVVTMNPSSSITYGVQITDSIGCVGTNTVGVSPIALPSMSASASSSTICAGISVTLTASGSADTYTWNPGAITGSAIVVNPSSNTTYTATGTNTPTGCTNTTTLAITVNALPTLTTVASPATICAGSTTTLTGTGATTFLWNPGGMTTSVVNVTPASSTIYTLTGTNAFGCTSSQTVAVTVNAIPTLTTNASSSICSGQSYTFTATGASTYIWNPGGIPGNTAIVSPTVSTTYTVSGTTSGCTGTKTVNLNVNPIVSANAGPTRTLTCINTSTTLSGSSPSPSPIYSWTGPGIITGSNTASPTINLPGTYTLIVQSFGCNSSPATVVVSQNTIVPIVTSNTSNTITCSTPTANAIVSTTTTPVSYNWTGAGIVSGSSTATLNVNIAGSKNYTVTNTSNGCFVTGAQTVSQNTTTPSPTASASGTITCSTLTVALTGGPGSGVAYQWSGPGFSGGTTSQNATANAAGSYSLTVTDLVNGCTNIATTNVLQNTGTPVVTPNFPATLNCTLTSVSAGVSTTVSPVSYAWAGTGIISATNISTITVNLPGIKTYTVTNTSTGCNTVGNITVAQNITVPIVTTNTPSVLNCTLTSVNASATTTASPVSYAWTGSGITSATNISTITINQPGTKNYTLTNTSNGCTKTGSVVVTQNTVTPVATAGTAGSSITCTFANANLYGGPFSGVTYLWSGPGVSGPTTTQNTTGGIIGTYTLLVTDVVNGCTGTATTSVTQNTVAPIIFVIPNQTVTCSAPTATLTTSSSADPTTTYTWTSPFAGMLNNYNISSPQAFAAGIFTVGVSDTNNGCTATATVEVIADVAIPTVTLSANSATITCLSPAVGISATSNPSSVMYSWSPSAGIVAGTENTGSPSFNAPGSYSAAVTNTNNGCISINNTVDVFQDITVPSFTVTASPSTICSGNSSTITANGANTYSWSTGQTTSGIIDSPSSTTIYTITGFGTNGCLSVNTETVIVNASPVLSVSGATNICKGSTANLTANGATSYTWSTGANTATISDTPTITTTYTVNGDNGACVSSLMTTVSIILSKDITGSITSTAGVTAGDAILYKYTAALSQWDSVTTVPLTGSYTFSNIDSAQYVIRAMPTATNIQVTYAGSSISWQNATVITHGCTNNTTQNIQMIGLVNIGSGPGQLSGTITEGNGFGHRMQQVAHPLIPGNPIGGIIVKGGKNPGGQMFVQTTTNSSGQYTLTGLPISTGTNDYFIFVDIPGLDTNLTYHQTITSGNPQIGNLDFYVDSMYINPVVVTKVTEQSMVLDNKILLYPNPASQYFSIQYELINNANVQIELFDMIGNKVNTVLSSSQQEKDKYIHRVNTENLTSGIYFIKLKINNTETMIKLILTK